MPLLMCPNDNASMTTVERSGVQFDMCPSCRGVWLDRGELEKLMDAAGSETTASAPRAAPQPAPQPAPPPQGYAQQPYRGDDRYREQPRYRDDDYRYHKKKKRMDIFDIFD